MEDYHIKKFQSLQLDLAFCNLDEDMEKKKRIQFTFTETWYFFVLRGSTFTKMSTILLIICIEKYYSL